MILLLETDELPQLSANVELARQKLQETYNKSYALAEAKKEEVHYVFLLCILLWNILSHLLISEIWIQTSSFCLGKRKEATEGFETTGE